MSSSRIDPVTAASQIFHERFPDAEVLFLGGSVLRGEASVTSDLDILVIYRKLDVAWRDSFFHAGWPVEVFVHDPETLNYCMSELDAPSGVPVLSSILVEGRELPLPTELSRYLRALGKLVLDQGPPKLEPAAIQKRRYLITDLCDDLIGATKPEERIAIGARLYDPLADFHFRAQGLWSARGKSIPRRLRATDPELAARYIQAFSDLFSDGDKGPVIDLCREILAPYGGRLFENSRTDAPPSWRKPFDKGR